MLLERAHVTIQSFLWSKRLDEHGTKAEVQQIMRKFEEETQEHSKVGMRDFLKTSISDVISISQKVTSGTQGKTDASVKNVIIGKIFN